MKTLRELAEDAKRFHFNSHRRSDYYIACSPDAILALLDERDALKAELYSKQQYVIQLEAHIGLLGAKP